MSVKSKKREKTGCIVKYDDGQGCCAVMGADPDCEGALEYSDTEVVHFPNREAAKQAIRISAAWARLRRTQGQIHNSDFLEHREYLKIVDCFKA